MIILYGKNERTLLRNAAEMFIAEAERKLKQKEMINVALCGGRPATRVFRNFARINTKIWKRANVFLTDERLVPLNDEESNYKLITDTFGKKISKGKLFGIDTSIDPKEASKRYSALVKKHGRFDLVLLSAGENGHVAALNPRNKALDASGYAYVSDSPKPPKHRITMSGKLIRNSDFTMLMFISKAKRDAYRKFMDPKRSYIHCPAKVALGAKKTIIVTDQTI